MIVVNCEQGSPEWFEARAGVITASMFKTTRERLKTGPNKGDYKKDAHDYAFRLAIERIRGMPLDEGFQTYAMRRGNELEEDARLLHEERIGTLIEQTGIVLTDDRKFGGSADGLIGADGGSEYKCLIAPDRIRSIVLNNDFSDFTDQVQGCMWITGRKWWHFVLYCPALDPVGKGLLVHEVKRDDDYIAEMESDLIEFEKLVTEYEEKLKQEQAA